MLRSHQQTLRALSPSDRRQVSIVAVALAVALGLLVVMATLVSERAQSVRVSARVFPAALVQHLDGLPAEGQTATHWYRQPSSIAVLQGRRFLLDTGNSRILELDESGTVRHVLDGSPDERLLLDRAMAITGDGRYLYVANSGSSQILVLEPGGRVVKVLTLEPASPADVAPRPIGLAVTGQGELFVSDAENHRVLHYDGDGRLLQAIGSGKRAGGDEGFNTPAGLALDDAGNLYVVDTLNGRVVELSKSGAVLRQFGRLGDTAGSLSRPKDVAVDRAGNVYVSDGLLAAVQVFSAGGEYLGFVGREHPGDRHSRSLFQAPAGLEIVQDKLYVVDRFAGLFVFQLPR